MSSTSVRLLGALSFFVAPASVFRLAVHATDDDVPAQKLTYRLKGPTNASIDQQGVITWTSDGSWSVSDAAATNSARFYRAVPAR